MVNILAPSLLAANFTRLGEEVKMLDESKADWIHIDVMDGVFVSNISFGMPIIKAIRNLTKKPFDVHLMIADPDSYISDFKEAGADHLLVHYEACTHLHRSLTSIKKYGMKAGVAINPHTPISHLEDIIEEVDILLIMSVNPGFGGQNFIAGTYEKLQRAKELILRKNTSTLIQVDGGVNQENAALLRAKGADILVAGNCLFRHSKPIEAIYKMKTSF